MEWKDEKLTRLLYRYRQVFAPEMENGIPCRPELEEEYFIPEIIRFINENPNVVTWTHPTPSKTTAFEFILLGDSFSVSPLNSKSVKEAIKRAYKFSVRQKDASHAVLKSKFEPKLARLMALVIIAMLIDKNVSVISLSHVDDADQYLYLCRSSDLENPIMEAVQKLVLWLLFDPADKKTSPPDWYQYYPNTLTQALFTDKSLPEYTIRYLREQGWKNWEFTGIDDQSTAEGIIGQCLNDTNSRFHIKKLEKIVKSEASKQMIYSYLIGKTSDSAHRAMALLKNNCRIRFVLRRTYERSDDTLNWHDFDIHVCVSFVPPLSGILKELEDALRHLSENSIFSTRQYYALLRFLAVQAKSAPSYTIALTNEVIHEMYVAIFASDTLIDELIYNLQKDSEYAIKVKEMLDALKRHKYAVIIERMLDALKRHKILIYNKKKRGFDTVQFLYKDYRLLFEGAYYAYEFGRSHQCPKELLIEDIYGDSTQDNRNHLTLRFNRYVVVGIGFLHYLDEGSRERVLKKLLKYAEDFRVINRRIQMKALFLLSYILYDGDPLPIGLKIEIFKATFGSALYPFMLNVTGDLVLQNRKPYTDIMKMALNQSCVLVKDSDKPDTYYSQCDPFYFFWGGFIRDWRFPAESPMQKMKAAFGTQKEVWKKYQSASGRFSVEEFEKIYDQLCETCKVMKANAVSDKPNPNILPWIWAANALLFTIADFRNLMNQGEEFAEYAKDRMPTLIETAVLCDYFTRKYNRGYNEDGIDTPDVFLLCGAFRFVCAYSDMSSDYRSVELPQGAEDAYSVWLSKEKQIRYKALLYRLLSYTNYPITSLKKELTEFSTTLNAEKWKSLFLPYDRIPNCQDFIKNPRMLKVSVKYSASSPPVSKMV